MLKLQTISYLTSEETNICLEIYDDEKISNFKLILVRLVMIILVMYINCYSQVGGTMEEILHPAELHIMKTIMLMLSTPMGMFLLAGTLALAKKFLFVKRFGDLSLQTQDQIILGWSTSSL